MFSEIIQWLRQNIESVTESDLDSLLPFLGEHLRHLTVGLSTDQVDRIIDGIRRDARHPLVETRTVKYLKGRLVDIVDEHDGSVLDVTEIGFAHLLGLRHRTANAFILTPDGHVLLQRRAPTQINGQFMTIVGGHVKAGQTYEEGIRAEITEELDFPVGHVLEGTLEILSDVENYDEKWVKNREFRRLYVYQLSASEHAMIQQRNREYAEEMHRRTADEFSQWLREREAQREGAGEVYGFYEVQLDDLLKAPKQEFKVKDENTEATLRYLEIDDYYEGRIKVPFLSDLLNRILVRTPGVLSHLRGFQILQTVRWLRSHCRVPDPVTFSDSVHQIETHLSGLNVPADRIKTLVDEVTNDAGHALYESRVLKSLTGELIDVVDAQDTVVGVTDSGLAHHLGLRHRTANAFVFTPDGQVLLQRWVHDNDEPSPLSIFGRHVRANQTYETSIRQALLEELFLNEIETNLGGSLSRLGQDGQFTYDSPGNNENRTLYCYRLTEEEYAHILARKTLSSYHLLDLAAIQGATSAILDETHKERTPESSVPFTNDLLAPIAMHRAPQKQGQQVDPLLEAREFIERQVVGTPYYGVYLQNKRLAEALRQPSRYYDVVAVLVKNAAADYVLEAIKQSVGHLIPNNAKVSKVDCRRGFPASAPAPERGIPRVLVCVLDDEVDGVVSAMGDTFKTLKEQGCNFSRLNAAFILAGGKAVRNYPVTAGGGLGNKGLMKSINGEYNVCQTMRQILQFFEEGSSGVSVFEVDKLISIAQPLTPLGQQDVQLFGMTVDPQHSHVFLYPKLDVDEGGVLRKIIREETPEEEPFVRKHETIALGNVLGYRLSGRAVESVLRKTASAVERDATLFRGLLLDDARDPGLIYGYANVGGNALYLHTGTHAEFMEACRRLSRDLPLRALTHVNLDPATGAVIGQGAHLDKNLPVGAGAIVVGRTRVERGFIKSGAFVCDSRVGHLEAAAGSMVVAVEEPGDAVVVARPREIVCDVRLRTQHGTSEKVRIVSRLDVNPKTEWKTTSLPTAYSFATLAERLDPDAIFEYLNTDLPTSRSAEHATNLPLDALKNLYGFKDIRLVKILFGGGGSNIDESPILIRADGKILILRFGTAEEAVKYIISVQDKMLGAALPVPRVLHAKDDSTYFEFDGRYYYLETALEMGEEVDKTRLEPKHYAGMGRMAARVHNTLAGYKPAGSNPQRLREEIGRWAAEFEEAKTMLDEKKVQGNALSKTDQLLDDTLPFLIAQMALFTQRYAEGLSRVSEVVPIHGDFAYTNLRFDSDGDVSGIYDLARTHATRRVIEFIQIVFGRKDVGSIQFDETNFMAALEAYLKETSHPLTTDELRLMMEAFRSRFLQDLYNTLLNKSHRYYASPADPHYRKRIHEARETYKQFVAFNAFAERIENEMNDIDRDPLMRNDRAYWVQERLFGSRIQPSQLIAMSRDYDGLNKTGKHLVLRLLAELFSYSPDSPLLELCLAPYIGHDDLSITRGTIIGIEAVIAVAREILLDPLLDNETLHAKMLAIYGLDLTKQEMTLLFRRIRNLTLFQDLFLTRSRRPRVVATFKKLTNSLPRIESILKGEFSPLTGEIHPGVSCPVKCRFCYNAQVAEDGSMLAPIDYEGKEHALNFESLMRLADDYLSMGIEEIYISGGKEPFASPLTLPLIEHLRRKSESLIIGMLSIGTALGNAAYRETVVRDVSLIRISLDAASADVYANVKGLSADSGSPSLFDKICHNVKETVRLRNEMKSRLKIGLSFLCFENNYSDLESFLRLACRLGVDFVDVKGMVAVEGSGKIASFIDYANKMYDRAMNGEFGDLEIYFDDIFFRNNGRLYPSDHELMDRQADLPPRCYLARSGMRTTVVVPNGRVFTCINSSQPGYDRGYNEDWAKYRLGVYHEGTTIGALVDQCQALIETIAPNRHCTHGTRTDEAINKTLWKLDQDTENGYPLDTQAISPDPNSAYYDGRALYHKGLLDDAEDRRSDGDLAMAAEENGELTTGESALNEAAYVASRLPERLVESARNGNKIMVELHDGTLQDTLRLISEKRRDGWKVMELNVEGQAMPSGEGFYETISSAGETVYIISSIKGRKARFLSLLNALGIPAKQIMLRDFHRSWFSIYRQQIVPEYTPIESAVLCPKPMQMALEASRQIPDSRVEDHKMDDVHYVILRAGERAMLFIDLLDVYGPQVQSAARFLATPRLYGGLGVNRIFLAGECGGIGENVKVGDLILPTRVTLNGTHWLAVSNHVLAAELEPEGRAHVHRGAILTMESILSETIENVRRQRNLGILGVELELAHLADVFLQYPGIQWEALLLVTDLPGQIGHRLGDTVRTESLDKPIAVIVEHVANEMREQTSVRTVTPSTLRAA